METVCMNKNFVLERINNFDKIFEKRLTKNKLIV